MGSPFNLLDNHLINVSENEIILEIGTDKGEKSTEYFLYRAEKFKTKLITVDIDDTMFNQQYKQIESSAIEFYHMMGSQFVKEVLPTLGVKIKCVYLDNYDWNWNPSEKIDHIYNQIDWYKRKYNINMNNMDCQVEHMKQMIGIMPYMSSDGIVVLDDTYQREDNVFTGKGGPIVTYLLANQYKILDIIPGQGIILQNQNKGN